MSLTISLSTEQIERCFARLGLGIRFSAEETRAFATIPVVSCSQPVFLFPSPLANASLTLSNLMAKVGTNPASPPSFFEHSWYSSEAFMQTPCAPGWHAILMEPLADSISQPAHYIYSGGTELQLPTAIEVVIMLFVRYLESNEQLLQRKHTWCADLASGGRAVTVGAFGRNGVFLSSHPPNYASRGLGVCAKLSRVAGAV